MVVFQTAYSTPMDREYTGNHVADVKPSANIEEPVFPVNEIGQTVTEGRQFGTFIQTATAAIRTGAGKIELQPGVGGGEEAAGMENYGKDARETLREVAKVNEVTFTSVHTPAGSVANLSGFNPQQGSFSDEFRKKELDEVKSAIKFAAEAAQGGAVVVHTGEFQRTMFDAPWNKDKKFTAYEEEEEKAVKHLVDKRTGNVIGEIRLNQVVPWTKWNKAESDYTDSKDQHVGKGDYIDYENNKVGRSERVPEFNKETGTFEVEEARWDTFVKEAEELNKEKGVKPGDVNYVTPQEAFLYATTETQEKIAKGYAMNYGYRAKYFFEDLKKLKKAKEFYEKLEKSIPEEERWKIMIQDEGLQGMRIAPGLIPNETKNPTEVLDKAIREANEQIEQSRDMVTGQMQQALQQKIQRENVTTTEKYAKQKTMQGYAEAGIESMRQTKYNPYAKRDIFVAPENIFPEMGYGSHPEELIELVKTARKAMVERLTEKEIEKSSGRIDSKTGEEVMTKVNNPFYEGISKEQAKKLAERHIKATLDTQHMGMWFNNFKPLKGETTEKRRERFNGWFMDEVKKMEKDNIIGNIHIVDSIGGSHQHLPAGQGDLPVVEAIKYLKSKGYDGYMNSEAHGEERFGAGRIMVETWRAFGSPISGSGYGPPGTGFGPSWGSVQHGYFGRTYPPNFIFGAYSPSNEWTLWSEVPME
ncbi:MAG: sugar phosphate isomerase/epimerase [Nanoarchaeota archaeon]|nr:sugar phosphate isomerase/epimerase [Nanoarchaeota archaeon]